MVSVGRGLLGLPPKAAALASRVARVAPRAALAVGGAVAGGAAFAAGQALLTPEQRQAAIASGQFVVNPATGELVPLGGGNGLLATSTMVTTVNRITGQIVKQRVFQGSPFIMNKEVAHLKSVVKKITRAHGKVPTKTRKQSVSSMISDAIKDAMLRQAQSGAAALVCPPSGG